MPITRNPIAKLKSQRNEAHHPGLLLQRYLVEQGDPIERRNLLDAAIKASTSDQLERLYRCAFTRWKKSCSNGEFSQDCNSAVDEKKGQDFSRAYEMNYPAASGEVSASLRLARPAARLRSTAPCQTLSSAAPRAAGNQTQRGFKTRGRIIIGLGSDNVLETGIHLHHTYGTPIIPGSSLKGLASHYCHQIWGQSKRTDIVDKETLSFRQPDGLYHRLLFGTAEDRGDAGIITFHDAWITPESLQKCPDGHLQNGALALDVMTPHHQQRQNNSEPPTDFDRPLPVSFLSVHGTFRISLSWSGPREVENEIKERWLKLAWQLLEEALKEWGVGGKTSSGYGRLCKDEQRSGSTSLRTTALKQPTYKRDDQITVTRIENRNGKVKFEADDGVLGHFTEKAPEVAVGQAVSVYVVSFVHPEYTLTQQKPKGAFKNNSHTKRGLKHQ